MWIGKPLITLPLLALLLALSTGIASAKSTLWKVSSDKGTLYVQGSAHVLKAENYPLAPAIEQAYSNSTALVLEVDMGEMMSPKTQQLIMGMAMLKQPDTLKSVLKPTTYKTLANEAAEVKLPLEAIGQFKPWFATMTLTLVKMKSMGLDESYGLDKHFYERAQKDEKKVIGLESVDFQISLLDSLSEENPDDFVNRALIELDELESELNALLEAWETGDFQTLETIMSKSFEGYPEQYEKFINTRNRAWVKKLSGMVSKEETYMVVVGAGHLPGDEGVINLLKKKGFTAEQL